MNKVLEKLEYNKVLEILSSFAVTYIGKDLALTLKPSNDVNEVKKLLQETTEGAILLYRKGNIPLFAIPNIETNIKQLESNLSLSIKGLLDVTTILKLARELLEYFDLCVDNLYSNIDIEKIILSSIVDENTLDDRASDALYAIRRSIKKVEDDIRSKLNNFIRSNTYGKFIQEPIVTIRSDRFCIPVKQEYRNEIKGFIHDMSSSGFTVFIEPMIIFDLNNELNKLKLDEMAETEKILARLSALLFPIINEIKLNLETIGKLDLIFAKAKYAIDIKATEPIITEKKEISLIRAKHPLIDKNKVVSIDINIGNTFNTLVITGPNTGGKTVTLKTVGLLSLMACSGMHIPASEKSIVHVFDNVLVDIGDEQSIEESLSTFSSHMTNIIKILNTVTSNSLVLLDELGSGTDPLEGASLALSILDNLYNKNTLTIATTHYTEIKHYVLNTKGFKNASVEFDLETLTPTYRLLMDVPGKSYAFAISEKLGLPTEVLDKAKTFMHPETINIEYLLKSIFEEKALIQNEKETILKEKEEITKLKSLLEQKHEDNQIQEKEKVESAKIEARNILLSAKEEANRIIKEMNASNNNKFLNEKRRELNNKIDNLFANYDKTKPRTIKLEANLSGRTQYAQIKSTSIASEINVIGLTVDEAIPIVDKYIDNAVISSLKQVRIVHGKGTGALRTGIHKFLKTNSHVKSFRVGSFGEGEMGVTVVEIK